MMKNKTLKNALLGIAIAIVAAYLFPVIMLTILDWPKGFTILFTVFPLYALFYGSWLVIPLGVALGVLIPRIAYGKSRWMASVHGAGFGVIAGLAASFCFTSVFRIGNAAWVLWIGAMAYCALWAGGYAFYRARGQSLYR